MMTFITVALFLSLLIIVHEIGHFALAKKFGLFVEEFGLGLPPRAWGKKLGETIYSVNWLPFGGYVKIAGENGDEEGEGAHAVPPERVFYNIAIWKRLCILVGGVAMNFVFGWLLLSGVFMVGTQPGLYVAQVQKGSPAEAAGLIPNDRFIDFDKSEKFVEYVKVHAGESVAVRVERAGKGTTVTMVPRKNPPQGEGPTGIVLGESIGREKLGPVAALGAGFTDSLGIMGMTFKGLYTLVAGAVTGKGSLSGVTGPVGIVKMTADASKAGLAYFFGLMALISLNLAAFNILPFPALDGGRVLFLAIEKVKGSPLPKKFEQYANMTGMAVLLLLIAIISVKDVIRLF